MSKTMEKETKARAAKKAKEAKEKAAFHLSATSDLLIEARIKSMKKKKGNKEAEEYLAALEAEMEKRESKGKKAKPAKANTDAKPSDKPAKANTDAKPSDKPAKAKPADAKPSDKPAKAKPADANAKTE